jgi:Ca-activated chloride channel family protein
VAFVVPLIHEYNLAGKGEAMKHFHWITASVILAWIFGLHLTTDQTQDPKQQPETIRISTTLVTVPVSAIDRTGRFVTGLTKGDFQIFEDGKPQGILMVSGMETPFNVALLLDTSRSTRESLNAIRKAALSFVNQLQPQDRVLIVTFDDKVSFHGEFTNDRRLLQRTINSIEGSYSTSMYDAISRTVSEALMPLKGRKAIVIFTDGVDTYSKQASCESSLDLAARSQIPIYAVQYNAIHLAGTSDSPCTLRQQVSAPILSSMQDSTRQNIERHGQATNFLQAIAELSGARYLEAEKIENSKQLFAFIAEELRHQYILEYYSTNDQQDGEYRRISVQTNRDDLTIRALKGYRVANIQPK